MIKNAKVLSVEGRFATVKSERSSMCDGCHKSSCGSSCAMGAVMGTDKSVTVTALNEARAEVGDTVELETRSSTVLFGAFMVFILPIVMCAVFYAIGTLIFGEGVIPAAFAVIGFVCSYVGIGFYERFRRTKGCDIVITRITEKDRDLS